MTYSFHTWLRHAPFKTTSPMYGVLHVSALMLLCVWKYYTHTQTPLTAYNSVTILYTHIIYSLLTLYFIYTKKLGFYKKTQSIACIRDPRRRQILIKNDKHYILWVQSNTAFRIGIGFVLRAKVYNGFPFG